MNFGFSLRSLATCLSLLTIAAGTASIACAQTTKKTKTPAKAPTNTPSNAPTNVPSDPGSNEIYKGTGKFAAMQDLTLKVTGGEKEEMFITLLPDTSISYMADADSKWLSQGMYVRFSSGFDATGKATAPLRNLEVFHPITTRRITPDQMLNQTPGIYPEAKGGVPGAKDLFKDKASPDKGNKPAPPANAGSGPQSFRVVGQIVDLRQNTIMIATGAQPIQVELDPSAKISVVSQDLDFVAPGDEISYRGLRNPNQPSLVQGHNIEIKGAKKTAQTPTAASTARMKGSKSKDAAASNANSKNDKRASSKSKKAAADKKEDPFAPKP